jgi:hypothetical protein
MLANEEFFKNGRKIPDKVVSGVNLSGNSCGGVCVWSESYLFTVLFRPKVNDFFVFFCVCVVIQCVT